MKDAIDELGLLLGNECFSAQQVEARTCFKRVHNLSPSKISQAIRLIQQPNLIVITNLDSQFLPQSSRYNKFYDLLLGAYSIQNSKIIFANIIDTNLIGIQISLCIIFIKFANTLVMEWAPVNGVETIVYFVR